MARDLWSQTDLTVDDVDVAELYDGFSIIALLSLEALGFCGEGEGGPFVEGGERISIGGPVPLNTDGGQFVGWSFPWFRHAARGMCAVEGRWF